jgi:DNA-binding PadR family transcriptional regulator
MAEDLGFSPGQGAARRSFRITELGHRTLESQVSRFECALLAARKTEVQDQTALDGDLDLEPSEFF